MEPPSRVCLGVVVGAKGLRGEVRIKSFTQEPEGVGAYGSVRVDDGRTFKVSVVGMAPGVVIAKLSGIVDRTAADGLKGARLYVDRGVLPAPDDGAFYHADLIGAEVRLTSGEVLGKVSALHNCGAGDMVEVGEGQHSVLIPLTREVVAALDLTEGQVTVHPVPGLLPGGPDDDQDGADG